MLALPMLCGGTMQAKDRDVSPLVMERQYRADAYVGLMGVIVFSRSDVGGGFARLEEDSPAAGDEIRLMFASGSLPERAHGLNRMGFIEERIEKDRAAYFGFVTANGEESLADAKKALSESPGDRIRFVAARGTVEAGRTQYRIHSLLLPPSLRWTNARELRPAVEGELQRSRPAETDFAAGQKLVGTFLHSVLDAVRTPALRQARLCVHNGKLYELETAKKNDTKMGRKLVAKGLMASETNAMQLDGALRNTGSGESTAFRLWYDNTSANPLPLRFEFQPKYFLKLVFEAER